MKKIFWIVLIVVSVILAGGVFWYLSPLSSVSAARVLPEKPMLYLQFSNAQQHWEEFRKSPLGENLSKININPFIRGNQGLTAAAHSFKALRDVLNTPDTREYLNKFLGREVTIAVYRNKPGETSLAAGSKSLMMADQSLPQILWISRVPSDMKFKEWFLRVSPASVSDGKLEKIPYRDFVIYLFPIQDTNVKIAFARIGDVFAAGLSDEAVRTAIDVYKGARPSLAADRSFEETLKDMDRSAAVKAYWNMEDFFGMMSNILTIQSPDDPSADEALAKAEGFTSASGSMNWDEAAKIVTAVKFDPARLDPAVKSYVEQCTETEGAALKFAPKDVLLYQWMGCLNFKSYWEEVKKEIDRLTQEGKTSSTQEAVRKFESSLGLSIEGDLLPALGSEIGWFASIGSQSLPMVGFKVPQAVVFLKINDFTRAEKVLGVLMSKVPVERRRELHAGLELVYLAVPVGGAIEPGYVILGDYVLIGLNREVLKESINALVDKRLALSDHPSLKKVVDLSKKSKKVGVFYFKLGELLDRYSGAIDMLYKWMAAQNQAKAQQQAQVLSSSPSTDPQIQAMEAQLAVLQKRFTELDEAIWQASSQGADISAQTKEIQSVQFEIESLQERIRMVRTQAVSLVTDPMPAPPPAVDQSTIFWRNVLEPAIESLKTVRAFGVSSEIVGDSFVSETLIQLDK